MAIKQEVLNNRLSHREAAARDRSEDYRKKIEKNRRTLRKLLSGEAIGGAEGREFYWELISNSDAMRKDPMTGNAKTYFNLGERLWAETLLDIAMGVSIDLFQKMQKEAIIRKQNGGTE